MNLRFVFILIGILNYERILIFNDVFYKCNRKLYNPPPWGFDGADLIAICKSVVRHYVILSETKLDFRSFSKSLSFRA